MMHTTTAYGLSVEYATGTKHTLYLRTRTAQRNTKRAIKRNAKVPFTIKEVK